MDRNENIEMQLDEAIRLLKLAPAFEVIWNYQRTALLSRYEEIKSGERE